MGRAQWEIKQDTLPDKKTSKLGGIIYNYPRRPQGNQLGAIPWRVKQAPLEGESVTSLRRSTSVVIAGIR